MSKLNPWVEKRIPEAEKRGSSLRYIIEVVPGTRDAVKTRLSALPDLSIVSQPANKFIVVTAPSAILARIANIPEVVKISADTVAWIKSPLSVVPAVGIPKFFDPWVGEITISSVEIGHGPIQGFLTLPFIWAKNSQEKVLTTSITKKLLGVPEDNKVKIKVAILDTGGLPSRHPAIGPDSKVTLLSFVPGEAPIDGMAHGAWVQAAAFGSKFIHPKYGECDGIASPQEQTHGKVLSNLGFGMTSWILDGMYWAVEKYGARVVSMSLGGPLQGGVFEDPMCRLIFDLRGKAIFVIAAGNDSAEWTIGSPGASPDAVTIGSWGITRNSLAGFSSRGPSGEFYKENPAIWEKDLAAIGEDLIKPDAVNFGGDDLATEKLLSAGTPWYGPISDPIPGFSIMHGTSQATPLAAGLIALALDRGYVSSAKEVKERLARFGPKDHYRGYGLMTWSKLL